MIYVVCLFVGIAARVHVAFGRPQSHEFKLIFGFSAVFSGVAEFTWLLWFTAQPVVNDIGPDELFGLWMIIDEAARVLRAVSAFYPGWGEKSAALHLIKLSGEMVAVRCGVLIYSGFWMNTVAQCACVILECLADRMKAAPCQNCQQRRAAAALLDQQQQRAMAAAAAALQQPRDEEEQDDAAAVAMKED